MVIGKNILQINVQSFLSNASSPYNLVYPGLTIWSVYDSACVLCVRESSPISHRKFGG